MQFYWYDEARTMICWELPAYWTWEEFHPARREINILVRLQPHTVHCFILLHNNRTLPGKFADNMKIAVDELPPNAGLIFAVGVGLLTQTLYSMTYRLFFAEGRYFGKLRLAQTVEQAVAIVREHDKT